MSTRLRLVKWNRAKLIYDTILLGCVTIYITSGMIIGRRWLSPADDPASWAQFLGPRRDGVSLEKGLNADWEQKKPPRRNGSAPASCRAGS